ncbi:MAG: hypothetical protein ACRYG6_13340 [Janthinobacterium lividum]
MLEHFFIVTIKTIYNWFTKFTNPTILVATIVLIVTIQQYSVAKEKLRLDSYDKRYHLFELTRTLLDFSKPGNFIQDIYSIEDFAKALESLSYRVDDALFLFKGSNIHVELKGIIAIATNFLFWTKRLRADEINSRANSIAGNANVEFEGAIPLPYTYYPNTAILQHIAESRLHLQVKNKELAALFSEYLVIEGKPPLTVYASIIINRLSAVFSVFRLLANAFSNKLVGVGVFPLSRYSTIIIVAVSAMWLLCLWIVIG